MNSMKMQNDRILKEELPRSVGAQYPSGDQWRNNSRKNEGMKPKQKQYPVLDVTSDRNQKRQWHPTPVLLPGKSHGCRNLVGCSPWGRKSRTRLSDFTFTFHFPALENEMATHSSVIAWRIPGMGEPGGCCLWGYTESDTTEVI